MKLAPFKLERYFAQYEFKAPYLLSSSDCESLTINDLLAMDPKARRQLKKLWLGYTDSEGSPELREAITALYDHMAANQVIVTTGAEEAIFLFMNSMLDKGSHIIVHTPCYQSLMEVAVSIGCQVTQWHTYPYRHWELDLDFLEDNIRPTTRAIIINCPHNPTGYLMSHQTQQRLIEIARKRNLILFSDEVYRYLEYNPADRLPAACDVYENAVSLGVMSKSYGLAGLRIGWLATQNQAIRAAVAAYKDYISICNSAPSELLSIVALKHHEAIVTRNLNIVRANLLLLDEFFQRYRELFDWWRPKAGSIAFPRLNLDRPVEDFCVDVVERSGVMLLPGTSYTANSQHFRIGFGRANMPEALQRFDNYLRAYILPNPNTSGAESATKALTQKSPTKSTKRGGKKSSSETTYNS